MNIKSIQITWSKDSLKKVQKTHHPHPIQKSEQSRDISCAKKA